jgi:hypothetical protein
MSEKGSETDIEARRFNVAEVPEDSGDQLPGVYELTARVTTLPVRSGRGSRPHLDKDERKIVRRHLDKLE